MSDIVRVNFHGEDIVVHRDGEEAWVAMKPLCANLGLHWHGQRQRIHRHPVLSEGACVIHSPSAGGEQETVALELRLLPGWLFGIDANRVKPELRDKLVQYQKRCFEVLYRAVFGMPERPVPRSRPPQPYVEHRRLTNRDYREANRLAHWLARRAELEIREGLLDAVSRRPDRYDSVDDVGVGLHFGDQIVIDPEDWEGPGAPFCPGCAALRAWECGEETPLDEAPLDQADLKAIAAARAYGE